jgi:hypothetical protein
MEQTGQAESKLGNMPRRLQEFLCSTTETTRGAEPSSFVRIDFLKRWNAAHFLYCLSASLRLAAASCLEAPGSAKFQNATVPGVNHSLQDFIRFRTGAG